jgi:hypothetical protein
MPRALAQFRTKHLVWALLCAATFACGGEDTQTSGGTGPGGTGTGTNPATPPPTSWEMQLAARQVAYSQALRTASLKLVGDLPTAQQINDVMTAPDIGAAYGAQIDQLIADPRFSTQMVAFFRNTFKMGGMVNGVSFDGAPSFAAQLVVEGRSFMELFTAGSGTCPTLDAPSGKFTAATCDSGAPSKAGVLTNPDVQRQFFSNLAFRRARWVQETFDCARFPAEVTTPQTINGNASYTSPWDFTSIAGAVSKVGRINFQDTSGVVCANCHTTINHFAPLLANFDANGMYQTSIQVKLPITGSPTAMLSDYLPPGQGFAWRHGGTPVTDLAGLGAALAADPNIATCAVARVWNWAMDHDDIVGALALVPAEVIQQEIADFTSSGFKLRATVAEVFKDQNFVKF